MHCELEEKAKVGCCKNTKVKVSGHCLFGLPMIKQQLNSGIWSDECVKNSIWIKTLFQKFFPVDDQFQFVVKLTVHVFLFNPTFS